MALPQPIAELPQTVLRFHTCGGTGDGKSTLIAKLLADLGLVLERTEPTSRPAERRFFSSPRRRFVVADAPGDDHSTSRLVAGASTADLSLLLIDAKQGLLEQTRRHSCIVSSLGIQKALLVVNKLDLVGYSEEVFARLAAEYRRFAERLGFASVACLPVSALRGDNVCSPSPNLPWYRGPTLLDFLEEVEVPASEARRAPLRLPVQWLSRAGSGFRGFAGTIASGSLRAGDAVRVQPSGRISHVARIVGFGQDEQQAEAGQAVMVTLADPIEVARGDLISGADEPAEVADQFEATVIWMGEAPLLRGRSYLMKLAGSTVNATISPIKYKLNIDTLGRAPAPFLAESEIGVCNLELDRPIAYTAYAANRDLGGFLLIDQLSNETVGAGMLRFSLRRAHNIHWQALDVDKRARATLKSQRPCVLWFTGFSGAGKSVIANLLDKKLHSLGRHSYLLDGDNVRHGLNKDLGFTAADRVENIRRIAEVAKLMVDAGLIVSTAFISPFRAERRMARALFEPGEFIEIFVDTPLAVAEERDPKGLYKKARRGELKNFTGIDSPYERPENPDLVVDTVDSSAELAAEAIVSFMKARGLLDAATREH